MIRFTKAKPGAMRPVLKSENTAKASILERLRAFLDGAEPEAVMFLYRNILDLSNAVTYKELREAYLSGGISDEQFRNWQHEYAKLVRASLLPKWEQAQREAAEAVKARFPGFVYEPSVSAGLSYIRQHAAELVTNLAQDQKDAINAMILHVSAYTAVTPDEAARIIRPCIGLTRPQALANLRYREAVESAYLKAHPRGKPETAKKKAKEAAAKYGARQHRYRSMCIARTELAFGYNAAHYGATKDAQAQGLIGDCVKRWLTAFDERVCPICSRMDEEAVNMDAMFSCGTLLPPAHPHCRCGVAYEEIEGAMVGTGSGQPLAEIADARADKTQSGELPGSGRMTPTGADTGKGRNESQMDSAFTDNPISGTINTTSGNMLVSDKYYMPEDKIKKYLLKPGAKHSREFFDVGYSVADSEKLNSDIDEQYDESKSYDKRTLPDGTKRYSIDMDLGITKKRPFQTVWQVDPGFEKARFITAHRKDFRC